MNIRSGKAQKLEVTVTYLEMVQRPIMPTVRQPSVDQTVALLLAEKPNVKFYRYLYETIGEAWLWYERREITDSALESVLNSPLVEIYVLYVGGVPAGYAELDRRQEGEIELAYFGLMPEFIGLGFGAWLLDRILDTAWRHKPERVWLHTCTLDHPEALRLYQRAGFVPYSQETKYISDPRESGLFP